MTVFVTDGAERTSLAIAKSLGKEGIGVHSGESYRFLERRYQKLQKKFYIILKSKVIQHDNKSDNLQGSPYELPEGVEERQLEEAELLSGMKNK